MAQYTINYINLEVVKGDSININIAFVDASDANVAASLFTSGKCQVRRSRGQDVLISFDTALTTLVLTDGNINLNAPATTINGGKYIYDIELVMTTGQVTTPIKGAFNVISDVTI